MPKVYKLHAREVTNHNNFMTKFKANRKAVSIAFKSTDYYEDTNVSQKDKLKSILKRSNRRDGGDSKTVG